MHTLNITVSDLTPDTIIGTDVDGGPLTIGDAVVVEAARQLVTRGDGYNGIPARIRDIRTEMIRELVTGEIVAALTEPTQHTNEFGEPYGPPTTLRELIAKATADALKPSRDRYGAATPLEKFLRDEVDRALLAELKTTVDDEKAKVVNAIRAKAAELIAQAVKEGIGR